MKRTHALLAGLLVGALIGCGGNHTPTGPEGLSGVRPKTPAEAAALDSAHLLLHVTQPGGLNIVIHPQMNDWDEMAVTWNDLGTYLSPYVIGVINVTDTGWVTVDISTLVYYWRIGIWENFGLVLDQNAPEYARNHLSSRESGLGPRLRMYCTADDSCFRYERVAEADAFVREDLPDENAGADVALYAGWTDTEPGERRTLIKFDLTAAEPVSSVGDRAWNDGNVNGIQDPGESGLAEVVVRLYDCSESLVAETVTDANGNYHFDSVTAGSYMLQFEGPTGYYVTSPRNGFDPELDSDPDQETGFTPCFDLPPGVNDRSHDAGFFRIVASEPGCTQTTLYWFRHTGFRSRGGDRSSEDLVSPLLPIHLGAPGGVKTLVIEDAQTAARALSMFVYGRPWNAITRLYAHLLTAKLNIANGASPAEIEEIIGDADAFLAANDWKDWRRTRKDIRLMVTTWNWKLFRYNTGKIGPGRCDG
jgi:hypothetical protein